MDCSAATAYTQIQWQSLDVIINIVVIGWYHVGSYVNLRRQQQVVPGMNEALNDSLSKQSGIHRLRHHQGHPSENKQATNQSNKGLSAAHTESLSVHQKMHLEQICIPFTCLGCPSVLPSREISCGGS